MVSILSFHESHIVAHIERFERVRRNAFPLVFVIDHSHHLVTQCGVGRIQQERGFRELREMNILRHNKTRKRNCGSDHILSYLFHFLFVFQKLLQKNYLINETFPCMSILVPSVSCPLTTYVNTASSHGTPRHTPSQPIAGSVEWNTSSPQRLNTRKSMNSMHSPLK